jgi:uncharacterized protein YraI
MRLLRTSMLAALTALAVTALPAVASAANGFATATVNERAGPGFEYPIVAVIPAGAGVTIYGCLGGYAWCDVDWFGNRGWVSARYLQGVQSGQRFAFPSYAPRYGIPIVIFSFGNCWDDHYRRFPWYRLRRHWDGGNVPGGRGSMKSYPGKPMGDFTPGKPPGGIYAPDKPLASFPPPAGYRKNGPEGGNNPGQYVGGQNGDQPPPSTGNPPVGNPPGGKKKCLLLGEQNAGASMKGAAACE